MIDERFESMGPVTGGFVIRVVYQTATDYSRLRVTCRCSIIFRNNSESWEFFCDSIPGLNGILKCVTRCESDLSKFAISESRIILKQNLKKTCQFFVDFILIVVENYLWYSILVIQIWDHFEANFNFGIIFVNFHANFDEVCDNFEKL